MIEFELFDDPLRFRGAVAELLERDPIGSTILSAVLDGQLSEPDPGEPPLMGCLRDVDGAAVAVLRVPSFPLLVAVDPEVRDVPAALRRVVHELVRIGAPVIGLHGRREVTRDLAAAWTERTGVEPALRMWSLLYRLREIVEPVGVPGVARPLDPDDPAQAARLAGWLDEFGRETGVARPGRPLDAEFVRRSVGRGHVYTFWWLGDGPQVGADSDPAAEPVAVAGHAAVRADGGCRVAPVYTSPQWRRRRFGAAATVAAVRSAAARGAREITLFTDEDYRPSNELYRGLGFEPIAEFAEFDLPVTG